MMRLRVLLPEQVFLDTQVSKITAEAENGSFGLLSRHQDFVTALVAGILTFTLPNGQEEFLAVDEGILVKQGADVRVSTRNAVLGHQLGELKRMIEERFKKLDEFEKKSRDALYKMEADLVRRFLEFEKT
ncbi:MAG: F0F1 ATP synthase subunit epsilon [Chloroflexota bacterium]